jgi:UDP-glucose 4-epimerase
MRIKSFRSQGNGYEHEIYNIGGGAPYSMLDLIEKFQAISKLKLSLEIREKVAADVEKTIADTTKLKRLHN